VTASVRSAAGATFARLGTFRVPDDLTADLVARLGRLRTGSVARRTDPLGLFPALGEAVDTSMPWQPPFVEDAVTGVPDVRAALRPLAEAVLASPAAAWWGTDLDRDAQWVTRPVRDGEPAVVASPGPAAAALRRWQRNHRAEEERSRDDVPVEQAAGGLWWSTPHNHGQTGDDWAMLPSSTRRLGPLGAVELALVEDGFGDDEALLHPLRPAPDARVLELHSAEDWGALVSRYPMRARWSRRSTWWASTGREEDWLVPDYRAVAADHDGIHLSVQGYLAAAGRAVDVDGGATVLAGWAPDATYWLTDTITVSPETERWTRQDDDDVHVWWRD
jgi:hypothetical protein